MLDKEHERALTNYKLLKEKGRQAAAEEMKIMYEARTGRKLK